ncbi:hypothetical protein BU25DRAFT_450769 [Macroventuria anomochaeta]|uniref:Uncharacterized protein n=1 Tax=Macroventuria anomochaeta TaxID=301207 RepID=A0ACB6RRP1_9PLEO|nr:uncharacterized protein BU25DRAFT_450769 [Macroventuria anomochaeta]KAF2624403.1 hypothetical protein BU25DRAFT_450769 [Macroventuria anomochaeta]
MLFATSSLIVSLLTLPTFVTSSNCYSRNGTLIADIAYQPCSSSGESACCGTNHDGAGDVGVANDVCETNGLCQNYEGFDGTNEGVKLWWRQGCTDPTWSSPNCLASVCDTAEYEDDNAPVYSCGNGNWACGKKSYCSTSSRLFTLAATVGKEVVASPSAYASFSTPSASTTGSSRASTTSASASSASPSTTGMPVVTATPSSTGSSTSTPPLSTPVASSSLLSTAAKAGIGAGIAVFALLLGIILFLLHKIKKNKKRQQAWGKAEVSGQNARVGEKPEMVVYAREASRSPIEMPSNQASAQEINAQRNRMELPTIERAQEMGQGRERVELAASPSVSGRGRYA